MCLFVSLTLSLSVLAISIVSTLLDISPSDLTTFLHYRNITVCGQTVQTDLSLSQRQYRRDAFAAELYAMLFHRLIRALNTSLSITDSVTPTK